jgi:hypothetical protein
MVFQSYRFMRKTGSHFFARWFSSRIALCEKPVPTFSRDAFLVASLYAKNRFPLFRAML